MKNIFSILILSLFVLVGCSSSSKLAVEPEVLSAEYQIVTYGPNERGFRVYAEIAPLEGLYMVKGVVLNGFFFPVHEVVNIDTRHSIIDEYLPVQSMLIQNFEGAEADRRKDGIVFEIEGTEYYYKTEFKLK